MKLSMDNIIKSTNTLFTTAAKEANHLFNPKENGLANKFSSAKQSLHKLTNNKQTKPDIKPSGLPEKMNYTPTVQERIINTERDIAELYAKTSAEFNEAGLKLYDYTSQLNKKEVTDPQASKKEVSNSPGSYGRIWDENLVSLREAKSAAKKTEGNLPAQKNTFAKPVPMDVPTVPTAVKNASPGNQGITQANGATDYRPPVAPKSQLVKDYVAKMNGHKPVEITGEQSSHVKFDKPAGADLQKMTQKELLREYLRSMDS